MLTSHGDGLWTLAADHAFMGLPFGVRMTAIRADDGTIWLHSPLPLTEERRAAVAALGPVGGVFAPNLFHHLYAGDWATAFPEARLWLAPGLKKKRPDLTRGEEVGADTAWPEGIVASSLDGQPPMNETALFHTASRTLVTCDVLANLAPATGLWPGFYFWATGLGKGPCVNTAMRLAVRDRKAARASVDRLIALDPVRVILSHGAVVEAEGAAALRAGWAWCG
jgi:hypothetical protein